MSLAPEDGGLRRLTVRIPMAFVLKRILPDCYRVYDLPPGAVVDAVEIRQRLGINECDLILRMEHPDIELTRHGMPYPDAGSPSHLQWNKEEGE